MVRQTVGRWLLLWLLPALVTAAEPEAWVLPKAGYPVTTPSMQPGIGHLARQLDYQLFHSVAVVGADEISARWLQINNTYLKNLNCIGIVVNVASAEEMAALRTYTDIPLIAMSGESLSAVFGAVYPFVVDSSVGRVRQ